MNAVVKSKTRSVVKRKARTRFQCANRLLGARWTSARSKQTRCQRFNSGKQRERKKMRTEGNEESKDPFVNLCSLCFLLLKPRAENKSLPNETKSHPRQKVASGRRNVGREWGEVA